MNSRKSAQIMEAKLAVERPQHPEMFGTIQGEGRSIGRPAYFVRFATCNLHCWWCDTPYTWNWTGSEFDHRDIENGGQRYDPGTEIIKLSTDRIADAILGSELERVVFTGGEPLLQQAALLDIVKRVRIARSEIVIEIETNGTIEPNPMVFDAVNQFNVSPKLANSRNPTDLRRRSDVLDFYARQDKAWFKFVVEAPSDLTEVDDLVRTYQIDRQHVYLMPEGVTVEKLDARADWLVDECRTRGYGYSDRLHIRLFGDTRGT